MFKAYISIVLTALLAQQAMASDQVSKKSHSVIKKTVEAESDSSIMDKVSAMRIVQIHHFTPEKLMDGGSTYLVKGHFMVPNGKLPAFIFVTKDYKTVIYGQAFDAESGQPYSQFTTDEMRDAAAITYGNGSNEIVIVSDPMCPYCTRLEKELPKYKDLITAHIILISLPMHKEAPDAVRYILSKKGDAERFAALSEIADGKTPFRDYKFEGKELETAKEKQQKMEGFARELKVQGTPSLFDIKGVPMAMDFFRMLDQQLLADTEKTHETLPTDAPLAH